MQVRLMGVHRVKAKLADGTHRVYHYAWRGGPRMKADPKDERKFLEEWVSLTRHRDTAPFKGCFAEVIRAYLRSPWYTTKKASTREGYDFAIKAIEADFFDLPLAAFGQRGLRRDFIEWRDRIAETFPRKADLHFAVLRRIVAYGVHLEMIERNPLDGIEKVSDESRRDVVWTDDDIAAFKASASEPMVRALLLGIWTGQRQGDLLALTWRAYDGSAIRLRQGKTGADVSVKVSAELRAILDVAKARNDAQAVPSMTILTNRFGEPWSSGFKSSFRKASARAGVEGKTFHDLRGTFVTLAYRNGASLKDIAEITGHLEKDAERILRKHYLVSSAAVERIENRTRPVKDAGTRKMESPGNG